MGDGSLLGSGIKISTDSFSIKDCVLLINTLLIKYNINSTIHLNNNKPRIYIFKESMDSLISLTKPFFVKEIFC